ncbi:carbohydrate-binding domain-containing protein [Paenibacillus sp. PAMC21692]|uniref:carbohydrate-binding domain-containing protein n=1 Tax=Paenibacillus sp. PAMC21692 TaxID=2762320 RepID=UPI00164E41AE|nr:carbohydrate-binding domain-containing protein [Paenibacillus sp. PAMC21692]QNK57802.1 carbohydrate-binding domain-containing protein [Paenibacillus sp. PAMC21692]
MKSAKIKHYIGVIALCAVLLTSACSKNDDGAAAATAIPSTEQAANQGSEGSAALEKVNLTMDDLVTFDDEDYDTAWSADTATSITFEGASAAVSGSGAKAADDGSVSITAAGTYVLSGQLNDGQVTIDAPDETVHVVLNGVGLSNKDNSPFYIVEAGKVIVTLEEGTDNTLTDGADYVYADATADEPDAALFSKADLIINGTGSLTVEGNYNDGIKSKDDLLLVSGEINVKSVDDGLVGKDRVAALDGVTLTVYAGGDGLKSTNAEEEGKGIVAIGGGTFDIVSGNDAIQAETSLLVEDGAFKLVSGGGSANGETHVEERGGWGGGQGMMGGRQGGTGTAAPTDAAANTATESTSAKGLKAGGGLQVNGGAFEVDAADDAVHANGSLLINGGTFLLASGDDGIHADASVTIAGGTIDITTSYEGVEGSTITVTGGEIALTASDDGFNVAGGNDSNAGMPGRASQDSFAAGSDRLLTISGGTITVNANGDGLDANGSIVMSGGTVYVNGPTGNGNGSLDYDGTFDISGGLLIAAGSSGMVQATSETSTQQSILMTFPQSLQGGTSVRLVDGDGNEIAAFAPEKTFQSVLFSSPDIKQGSTYVIYSGDTKIVEFEVTSTVTWVNESGITTGGGMGMGGPGGGMGGGGGQRPDRGQRPEGDMQGGQPPEGFEPPADGAAPPAGAEAPAAGSPQTQ